MTDLLASTSLELDTEPLPESPSENRALGKLQVKAVKALPSNQNAVASRGLVLSVAATRKIKDLHILTRSSVEYVRNDDGTYKLRGNDSGGGTDEISHVVGYCGTTEVPLTLRMGYDNVVPNKIHAMSFGTSMVRIEVFRFQETFSIGITYCVLAGEAPHKGLPDGRPPRVKTIPLFIQTNGTVSESPHLPGYASLPVFCSTKGELVYIPEYLWENAKVAMAAARCGVCHHDHFKHLAPVNMATLNGQTSRPSAAPVSESNPSQIKASTIPVSVKKKSQPRAQQHISAASNGNGSTTNHRPINTDPVGPVNK